MPAPESDHTLTLLADADPIDVDNLLTTEEVDDAWASLDRRLASVVSEGVLPGGVRRSGRLSALARPRRAIGAAIAVAAAGAAAGVVAIPGAGPGASSLLNGAAALAAQQLPPNPGPGQYYHEEWRSSAGRDLSKRHPGPLVGDFQWYVRPNGSGKSVNTIPWPHRVTKAIKVTQWNVDGPARPRIKTVTRISGRTLVSQTYFGPGQFTTLTAGDPFQPEHPSALPIHPPALKRWLEHRLVTHPPRYGASVWAGGPEEEALLPEIANLLRNPTASSQLRSALFTVAGEIPGVTVRQNVKDVYGRTGEAIVASADAGRYRLIGDGVMSEPSHELKGTGIGKSFELIFDPDTTQILATQYLNKKGQVTEYAVDVSQGVVNSDR